MVLRVVAMCVAVAMICSAVRQQRPEMATVISLAAGVVALVALYGELLKAADWVNALRGMVRDGGDVYAAVLKAAGIAVVSELGMQLCADAGESALAGRIGLASRVAILGLCAPLFSEILGLLDGVLP